jgi:hypothetical protein
LKELARRRAVLCFASRTLPGLGGRRLTVRVARTEERARRVSLNTKPAQSFDAAVRCKSQ